MLFVLNGCTPSKEKQLDQTHSTGPFEWVTYRGGEGPGKDKHILFVSGDEEYRSEEALPQLAKILAQRHGFDCTVLFAQNPKHKGIIDPNFATSIPGLEHLESADLMVLFTRFRALPDDQMIHFRDYLMSGKPVVAIRTATHAFEFPDSTSRWIHWSNSYKDESDVWDGGFGRLVLGEKWHTHHGHHKHQSTRGFISPDAVGHPIVRGLSDGDIWGPTDVYGVRLPLLEGVTPIVLGQVVNRAGEYAEDDPFYGMRPTDTEVATTNPASSTPYDPNDPMMPIAWTKPYQFPEGNTGLAFTSTIGSSTDLVNEGVRRLLVNAVYYLLGMDVPDTAAVDLIGDYHPSPYRFFSDEYWEEKKLKVSDFAPEEYPLIPVPFHEVTLTDTFWKPRLETQASTLVPFALTKTSPAVDNLRRAANFRKGIADELPFPHRFISSDLYKVMEGAAYLLQVKGDPELEKQLDEIIDIIADVQQDDGYLYVAHIADVSKDHDQWGGGGMGDRPYSFVLHSHELYNMGHMYEAAIAYYQATGKDKWLRVAEKNARHINKVFFEGDPNYNGGQPVNQAPGHQEIELALTKLYRVTGNRLYLEMAQKFLTIRGKTYVPDGDGVMAPTYAQQHEPIAEQREAVGHAVRAAYMYSAMADVGALTNSDNYSLALETIWHDIVDTKMHITGGLGAIRGIEGFGPAYELPNKDAYNETCAAVGNVFFNYRMFLRTREARYMDVAEIALYNNALAGVNLEGNEFFYVNPLEADGIELFNHGRAGRSPWFNTACCPSNIARLMPQVSGMMYARTEKKIYSLLYGSNETDLTLNEGVVHISQQSAYPYDEHVHFTLTPERAMTFTFNLRIPTWVSADRFVPGALYSYVHENEKSWSIKVNGEPVAAVCESGFAYIHRTWQAGDKIELYLPMEVRFNRSLEQVDANRNRVAVTRGPLVYCAESFDNGSPVQSFFLEQVPDRSAVRIDTIDDGLLKNVINIMFPSIKIDQDRRSRTDLTLIPYYAWNNRGDGSMLVWLPIL